MVSQFVWTGLETSKKTSNLLIESLCLKDEGNNNISNGTCYSVRLGSSVFGARAIPRTKSQGILASVANFHSPFTKIIHDIIVMLKQSDFTFIHFDLKVELD